MKLRLALLALTATGGAVAFGACSATGTSGPGTGGSGGDTISLTTSSTGTSSICEKQCSADLHSIVDCQNHLLSTCPPDQGCSPDGCVPACDSAKANKSTIGCDYYAIDPDVVSVAQGACFAAYVANTWGSPVTIQVERGGQAFDATQFSYLPKGSGKHITYEPLPNGELPPGEVAIVFLAATGALVPCPEEVNVGTISNPAIHGSGLGDAFHITTSAPVVVYDIFPYGGGSAAATSATLLLPTAAWDTNYVAVDAFRRSTYTADAKLSIDIVAAEDETEVTINPTSAITSAPGVPAAAQGQPKTYKLNKGQLLQFSQEASLLGSPIQSNKPVGVWGGATCLTIDVDKSACDSAHQQIPPVKALGSEYVAVRYRNRFDGKEESPPWRIVGAVAGTKLTYEPAKPKGAPDTLDVGQVAEFRDAGPFIVKSQDADHPFYMSGHMTGCEEVSTDFDDCRGDPEFVNVIPGAQYLRSYVFFTDGTYPETNLVLVRRNDGFGFQDVKLDCAGTLTGWQPIGTSGKYEYTRIDLVRHDFDPQGSCDNGRHEIHSDAPFGLVIWGWGTEETGTPDNGGIYSLAVSYAYPAGASVQPINTVVVPTIPK
ncbi:MAG: IgGFc-binding protein [Minicystis sp.]